ncbi:MAG: type IV toxin-antitoxin system AbiEi family antitoxin domain-containing protein [Actinomycetota bacterium]|nr:DUF559 domain-containing protein [Actinomycetota bacterium]
MATEPDSIDRRIAKLASAQHGVFSRRQVHAIGYGDGVVQHRLATGRWERVHRGVFRVAGAAVTWHQLLLAACLAAGPGAVVSHFAAAALWELPGFPPGTIELIVPRSARRVLPGIVHRPRSLPLTDVTKRNGIPVTTIDRTLLDLAAVSHPHVVEEALDAAIRRRLTSVRRLGRQVSEGSRIAGVALLHRLIKERSDGSPVPQSVLETMTHRMMKRFGLPDPVRQYRIEDGRGFVAVADFAYPAERVVIEADGYETHSSGRAWAKDRRRDTKLAELGWHVVRVTWTAITTRPGETTGAIRRVLADRRPIVVRAGNHRR